MKRLIFSIAMLCASLLPAEERSEKLFSEQLKRHKIERDHLGILISEGEAESSKIILSVNPSKKMTPASITKILTASAVLDHFLPGSKFKTQLCQQHTHLYLRDTDAQYGN